jgi:hypothetical protein
VRAQIPLTLVGDGLLQIRDDLGAVGVLAERLLGPGEVLTQGVVARFVELVGVAIQVDADDFLHGYFPSFAIVALTCFQ